MYSGDTEQHEKDEDGEVDESEYEEEFVHEHTVPVRKKLSGKDTRPNGAQAKVIDLGPCGRVPIYERSYGRSINRSAIGLAKQSAEFGGEQRILHGLDSVTGEWPWVVKLKFSHGSDTSDCTGTLLDSRWILTAAHCIVGDPEQIEAEATLGLYDMIVPDATSRTLRCDKIIRHPAANQTRNDLALVRLGEPVGFGDMIQPACLPGDKPQGSHQKLEFCHIIGYGLDDNMGFPTRLQKLEIEPTSCSKLERDFAQPLPDVICIQPRIAELGGSCRGDSGGPNLCYEANLNRWSIFGVISFGPTDCNRDRRGQGEWLTASVELVKYRQWLLDTMKEFL